MPIFVRALRWCKTCRELIPDNLATQQQAPTFTHQCPQCLNRYDLDSNGLPISKMKLGDIRYTVPWAYTKKRLDTHQTCIPYSEIKSGAATTKVERIAIGYRVNDGTGRGSDILSIDGVEINQKIKDSKPFEIFIPIITMVLGIITIVSLLALLGSIH